MKRKITYLIAVFVAFIGGLYVYLAFSNKPNKFWRNFAQAHVSIEGHLVSNAYVYKHPDGSLLIEFGGKGWAIYWPQINNIGQCNPVDYIPIPGYIFAYRWNDDEQPCVEMGTAKVETKPDLVKGDNYLEFTAPRLNPITAKHERVRIEW